MKRISVLIILILVCFSCFFSIGLTTKPILRTSKTTTQQPEQSQESQQETQKDSNTSNKKEEPTPLYKDNWFDFVNEFWQKYTTAEVIDVATLTRYTVKRVGGYNHADVEPINSTETNKMYSIYNYEWAWTRRPVWVKVNDRYIAASINGYPHAYDIISNNNMTGHTCIHFYKSRTHATNNWDPQHRAAVEEAYGSIDKFNDYIKQTAKNK